MLIFFQDAVSNANARSTLKNESSLKYIATN